MPVGALIVTLLVVLFLVAVTVGLLRPQGRAEAEILGTLSHHPDGVTTRRLGQELFWLSDGELLTALGRLQRAGRIRAVEDLYFTTDASGWSWHLVDEAAEP